MATQDTITLQNGQIPYYIRGNINFPNGVINQLILLGGVYDGEFNESELSNQQNIFYINHLNENRIFKCLENSITGELILSSWTELSPLTYIDEPESLPKSWADALDRCNEASIYEKGEDVKLLNRLNILGRLVTLRDIYRQGWKPKTTQFSYFISNEYGRPTIIRSIGSNHVLSFQDSTLAERFKENFIAMILECGDLI